MNLKKICCSSILIKTKGDHVFVFEQAEKERNLLSKRTREGMAKGRTAGRIKGVPQHQKKEELAKRIIRKNT